MSEFGDKFDNVPGQLPLAHECDCGLGDGYGWMNHNPNCPVRILGRNNQLQTARRSHTKRLTAAQKVQEMEKAKEPEGPLTAADIVKRKLGGK